MAGFHTQLGVPVTCAVLFATTRFVCSATLTFSCGANSPTHRKSGARDTGSGHTGAAALSAQHRTHNVALRHRVVQLGSDGLLWQHTGRRVSDKRALCGALFRATHLNRRIKRRRQLEDTNLRAEGKQMSSQSSGGEQVSARREGPGVPAVHTPRSKSWRGTLCQALAALPP